MAHERDDWVKTRSRGVHLSDDEIAFIRKGYREDRTIRDVARDLKCSSRNVTKYYGFFRAEGVVKGSATPKKLPLPDRFYKSSFELI